MPSSKPASDPMRVRAALLILWAAASWATALPAAAQSVASSTRPERVSITIYRDPQRRSERAINLRWLNGFALISEVRTIRIPAGEVELRFEGVAANILPQSAIVTGLPDELIEKNYDALLLSPSTLIDRSLGQRVHLRRTSRATGEVREQEAMVRSGAEGALVLQTEQGFEALRCTGLAETLIYPEVPEGLSAKPILSVRTRSRRAVDATVTLSYLASGFDWQADYVVNLSPDGARADLFAWLTLANSDETSFVDAGTQAVAGRVYHQVQERRGREGGPIRLQCWPHGTTSDIPLESDSGEDIVITGSRVAFAGPPPPPPPPPPPAMAMEAAMEASQEELGDLKLYRIPEPVTVASNSQKQVAFLRRTDVPVEIIYRHAISSGQGWRPTQRVLVTRNRPEQRLGIPLPAGRMVLFASGRERPILVGEGSLDDRAVGEDVEVELGPAPGVQVETVEQAREAGRRDFTVTVTNDSPRAVRFEGELAFQEVQSETSLGRRNGFPLWVVTIPANGRATLNYSVPPPRRG